MNTTVVVGHGLTPVNRNWGSRIDEATNVVRLWNYHWQDVPDWGQRYDYGLYELSPTEMARFWKHNIHRPSKLWLATKLKEYLGPVPDGATQVIDPERWILEAIDMGGEGEGGKRLKMTRGAMAAAWAIEQSPVRVILVGFDNMRAGKSLHIAEGFPKAYINCPAIFPFRKYIGGKVRYSSHDYAVEGMFIKRLAERHNVELVHAQDIWQ